MDLVKFYFTAIAHLFPRRTGPDEAPTPHEPKAGDIDKIPRVRDLASPPRSWWEIGKTIFSGESLGFGGGVGGNPLIRGTGRTSAAIEHLGLGSRVQR